jgi:protein-S-isoprenylcysteine O-methyltransferase Ste14
MEVFAGALKLLVRTFWYRSSVPSEFFFPIACDIWMVLCLYWVLSALRTKAVKSRESLGQRLGYVFPLALGLTLLFNSRVHYSWLGMRFRPDTIAVAVAGVVLTGAGVALAMWSRFVLGENWSAAVSIRKDHELICVGPYRSVRHPIYSGILLGLLGTVLVVGEVRGLLALVILWLGFYRKARKEEAFLTREFGAGFEVHAKHTGMFLPRVRKIAA